MFRQVVLSCAILGLLIGCGKKTVKNTAPSDTPPPGMQTANFDKGKPGEKSDKNKKDGDKPNWLNDPRYKKDKGEGPDAGGGEVGGLPGKPGLGFDISKPGGWAGNSSDATSAKPPSASAAANAKPVTEADMKEIWVFIDNRSGATDKMPSIVEIGAALNAARSHAADLIKDGSIVLTGARMRDAVWAYEKKARTQGGWVVSQNGVENLTAAVLENRLAGR